MAKAEVDVVRLASRLTMRVKLKRAGEFRWRLRIAVFLIRLAAWVAGVGIVVENGEAES